MNSNYLRNEEVKDFGNVVVLLCLLASFYFKNDLLVAAAATAAFINITFYKIYRPFASLWLKGSHALGKVTNKIVMGVAFYFIVAPIGMIRKLSSNDNFKLSSWKKDSKSVFTDIAHLYKAEDLEKPY